MTSEPTHAHAFPATHPRRVPGEPRRLRVADLYTRADAITDHLLIEIPRGLVELYRLPWPLALTSTAWADAIAWPPAAQAARPGTPQRRESVEGRLADVLFLVKTTQESAQPGRAVHPFTVWRVPAAAPTGRVRPLRVTLTIHPGDHAEPVATLAHSPPRPVVVPAPADAGRDHRRADVRARAGPADHRPLTTAPGRGPPPTRPGTRPRTPTPHPTEPQS